MVLDKLSPEMVGKNLDHWLVAVDGDWASGRVVPISPSQNERSSFLRWLSEASNDVAVEAVFKDQQDNFFFYGVRVQALSASERDLFFNSIFKKVLANFLLDDVLEAISEALGKGPISLGRPDFLELGAEGAWNIYGSYKVWDHGDKEVASLDDITQNAPQLLEPFEHAIVLEFAWRSPLPMWLGLCVSKRLDSAVDYQFCAERYALLCGVL